MSGEEKRSSDSASDAMTGENKKRRIFAENAAPKGELDKNPGRKEFFRTSERSIRGSGRGELGKRTKHRSIGWVKKGARTDSSAQQVQQNVSKGMAGFRTPSLKGRKKTTMKRSVSK